MKNVSMKSLSTRIQSLHNRVIEIKGVSVFNEKNTDTQQIQTKRTQNVKVREN